MSRLNGTSATNWINNIKQYGRQFNDVLEIYEEYTGTTGYFSYTPLATFNKVDINRIEYSIDSSLFKSDMGKLVVDINKSSSNFSKIKAGRMLRYKLQIIDDSGNITDECDYKFFIITEIEEQEDKKSVLLTCYDHMIKTMVDYETPKYNGTTITYPITITNYMYALMEYFKFYPVLMVSTDVKNRSEQIDKEHYVDSNGNSLNYTFRDVLDDIAEATGGRIKVDYYINTTSNRVQIEFAMSGVHSGPFFSAINEEYFKDKNVNIGKKIGPYNILVLSRANESDNIHYPETIPQDPVEMKISDNPILEQDNRENFIQGIYENVSNFSFYTNDFSTNGLCILEAGDLYEVNINNKLYTCILLSDNMKRTTGLMENITTDEPKQSETDYKYSSPTDRSVKNAKILVDKANASIEQIVTAVGDNGEVTTASIVQSINDSGSQIKLNADKVYINGVTFDNQQNMTITKGTINVEQAPGDKSLYTWYRDNYSNGLDEAEVIPAGFYTSRTGSNDNTNSSAHYGYNDMQISDDYGTIYLSTTYMEFQDSNNNTKFEIDGTTGNTTIGGEAVVDSIRTKNIFNKNQSYAGAWGPTTTDILSTGVRVNVDTGANRMVYYKLPDIILGKTITLSTIMTPNKTNNGMARLYYGTSSSPASTNIGDLNSSGSITRTIASSYPSGTDGVYLLLYGNKNGTGYSGSAYVDFTNLQIEIGDTATTYTSYQDLNNQDTYTLSEQEIGLWVNGKTLYRKVNNTSVSLSANIWTNLRYKSGEESLVRCLVSESDNFASSSYPVATRLNGNYIQVYSTIAITIKSVLIEYTKA